jgi:hypothetical protein
MGNVYSQKRSAISSVPQKLELFRLDAELETGRNRKT